MARDLTRAAAPLAMGTTFLLGLLGALVTCASPIGVEGRVALTSKHLTSLNWITIPQPVPQTPTSRGRVRILSEDNEALANCQTRAPLECGFAFVPIDTLLFSRGVLEFSWFTGLCSKSCLSFLRADSNCSAAAETHSTMLQICRGYRCADQVKASCGASAVGVRLNHTLACTERCGASIRSETCQGVQNVLPGFQLYMDRVGPDGGECEQHQCHEQLAEHCEGYDTGSMKLPELALCQPSCYAAATTKSCQDADIVVDSKRGSGQAQRWRDVFMDQDAWGPRSASCVVAAQETQTPQPVQVPEATTPSPVETPASPPLVITTTPVPTEPPKATTPAPQPLPTAATPTPLPTTDAQVPAGPTTDQEPEQLPTSPPSPPQPSPAVTEVPGVPPIVNTSDPVPVNPQNVPDEPKDLPEAPDTTTQSEDGLPVAAVVGGSLAGVAAVGVAAALAAGAVKRSRDKKSPQSREMVSLDDAEAGDATPPLSIDTPID
eukprot:CAMPEP_0117659682 /NCGR_PEP_ID=MMETSP0804-20121206/6562_1 /TAXON_ID=1074897 /ORGANISM="Tetraselmis astigmatica, Strain CCMP880" /LENGTH=490 /DNA_ID=CAMNT_0005466355 /DNA_START=224 /DNA_END=1696 /DNA_ORIENTATION=-